jgi:heat shock protein HslJ
MTARSRRSLSATIALIVVAALLAGCNAVGTGLTDATWQLTLAHEQNPPLDTVIAPEDQPRYTVTFAEDGTAAIKADCNNVTATYESTTGGDLSITPGASTMAMCPEDSLGTQFVTLLGAATSYSTPAGKLTIYIGNEGRLEFAAAK